MLVRKKDSGHRKQSNENCDSEDSAVPRVLPTTGPETDVLSTFSSVQSKREGRREQERQRESRIGCVAGYRQNEPCPPNRQYRESDHHLSPALTGRFRTTANKETRDSNHRSNSDHHRA